MKQVVKWLVVIGLLLSMTVTTAYAGGTVTITQRGSLIRITGDHASNHIKITWNGDRLEFSGQNSTIINRLVHSDIIVRPNTRVIITMKGGHDHVQFETEYAHAARFNPIVLRALSIHMGSGNDILSFHAQNFIFESITASSIAINMGAGDDTLATHSTGFAASWALRLLGSAGQDKLEQHIAGETQNFGRKIFICSGFETHSVERIF